jgi:hypothetical protein
MRALWSQMDEAWRDTLVHRAEGTAFVDLARLYGVPLPQGTEVSAEGWRKVLYTLAYGARGIFQPTYDAVRHAFSFLDFKITGRLVFFNLGLPGTERLSILSPQWELKHVNRLVRIGEELFFTDNLTLSSGEMELVKVKTAYWSAADAKAWERHKGATEFFVTPFVVHERTPGRLIDYNLAGNPDGSDEYTTGENCLFEVVFFESQLDLIPKTYLQNPSDYSDEDTVYTEDEVPYGGNILTGESEIGNPTNSGPYPLYAYDYTLYKETSRIFSSTLAASVQFLAVLNPPTYIGPRPPTLRSLLIDFRFV